MFTAGFKMGADARRKTYSYNERKTGKALSHHIIKDMRLKVADSIPTFSTGSLARKLGWKWEVEDLVWPRTFSTT